ncbi:MAG: tRNA (5-methylaminomethyl-2-thiouridine)(34)-methyltransferase MnmD [Nitratireductor sp.]
MTESKGVSRFSATDWRDNDLPVSRLFDDPYFSAADGRAETAHVFVGGNRLPSRWPDMQHCLIAELGFGTGLNFLETVSQWRAYRPAGARLSFVSFEQYPMSAHDIGRALSRWRELDGLSTRLLQVWQPEFEIIETDFADDIALTVFMSDANIRLPQLQFQADAWYLDGFSPAKNPQMWNAPLLAEVFRHTAPDATFATYSAAGQVRRDLQAAGFEVTREPGFGTKREMLAGRRPHA